MEFDSVVEQPIEFSVKIKELNPAYELPVLVDENATVVSGAYPISEYIDDMASSGYMMGNTVKQRSEIRQIIDWFDRKFHREVSHPILREKYIKTMMRGGQLNTESVRAAQKSILHHLDYIGKLHRQRKWLAGDSFTLADITAAAHLSCVDYFFDVPWEHNTDAKDWYALVKSRPSLRYVLTDRVSAFRPPEHYENPDF